MARLGVKPIIFLLNNSGYTIERYLHGKTRYVILSLVSFFFSHRSSFIQKIQRHLQLEVDFVIQRSR